MCVRIETLLHILYEKGDHRTDSNFSQGSVASYYLGTTAQYAFDIIPVRDDLRLCGTVYSRAYNHYPGRG